ncbi:hypothetical protein [Actinomadura atramentaria]|uniref:hypothetical protein n=1 Tax=Actinomadura atramentaria TaxID=1990 RepID=UPI0004775BFD|nr:hypothetical protein [Actinomadura atramentaria]
MGFPSARRVAPALLAALALAAPHTTVPRALAADRARGTVPCDGGDGGAAGLAAAVRAGGAVRLKAHCVYTITHPAGERAALPRVTRDVELDGSGSTIRWNRDRRLFSIAPGARVVLRDVRFQVVADDGGRPVANIQVGPQSEVTLRGGAPTPWLLGYVA